MFHGTSVPGTSVSRCSLSTGSLATVLQTELWAMTKLATNERMNEISGRNIWICTDSQSAIQSVGSPYVRPSAVFDCKVSFNEFSKSITVTVV